MLPSLFAQFLRRLPLGPLLFAFVLVGNLAGCGDPPSATDANVEVRAEPGALVFNPQTKEIGISIVNRSETTPALLNRFRIEGGDWDAFGIVEPLNPVQVPPGRSLRFTIRVDDTRFKGVNAKVDGVVQTFEEPKLPGEEEEIDPEAYRDGSAALYFDANGTNVTVPLAFEDPHWFFAGLLPGVLKIVLLVMAFIMPLASLLTWMERKQSAMMQDRVGPNMARLSLGGFHLRLWGLLHIATDGIKMLFKEDFIPRKAHRVLYTLAPLMALIPALVVFAIVPFGDGLCYGSLFDVVSQADVDQCAAGRGGTAMQIAHIDVGLLFYFAIASLATWGTTLAGWASYNKWAVLGALRATAQMISYEVAIGLTIVGALLVYGTLEPHALVKAQLATHWGILLQPVAFILFFTAAIAETKRAPFDLPEGESEIIGYFLEYSGMRFGLFFLGEFIEVVFVSALVTTLFLGGWSLPFGILGASGFEAAWMGQVFFGLAGLVITVTGFLITRTSKHGELVGSALVLVGVVHLAVAIWSIFTGWGTELPHVAVVAVGMLTWGIKVLTICWLQLLIRWTLPRFRYDQLMSLGWKGLLPLSIANIVLSAVVVYFMTASTGIVPEAANGQPGAVPSQAAPAAAARPPADAKPTEAPKPPNPAKKDGGKPLAKPAAPTEKPQ